MMLLIQRKNSWIGSLAPLICLILWMVLPVFAAQDASPTAPAPSGEVTAPADTPSASPTTETEQKAKPEATDAVKSDEQAQAEKRSKAKQARDRVIAALMNKDFVYTPDELIDPFISFVVAQTVASEPRKGDTDDEGPPKPQLPLTPLQKMAAGQIERGFKAVIWGDMGMRALIEDNAGKGYIVGVGTPLGGNNGLITDIQSDRLVIQQEVWDANVKQMVPQTVEIKLSKAGEKKP
ncbi:MAG TPA: hypothetical protein DCZ69_11945 [Syntrophobacteraceae bacterium]|jgi:Tfp pilus assembly protein PilP|nr:hypothetical protein [Syntrophobacteraceae bacterium]HBD08963.1 hypothetical protein [Syntrophobacteraceae bacterium]HBZ55191.1 hypothetical protein [Syntrophobacteraceae bacterium]